MDKHLCVNSNRLLLPGLPNFSFKGATSSWIRAMTFGFE
jgi:hypothetical protein